MRPGRWPLLIVVPVALVFISALPSRTDDDVHRYFAYASAALGRPFHAFYVRSFDAWRDDFVGGRLGRPADFQTTTPARALVPYRDFLVEYPPGFFLAALPPALIASRESAYQLLFGVWMAALLAGSLALCARIGDRLGPSIPASALVMWGTIAAFALGRVTVQRYDALVAFAVCAMCWATLTRRPVALGLAAGVGIAVKFVPGLVLVLCVAYLIRGGRGRQAMTATAVAIVSAAAICLPALRIGLPGLLQMIRYHVDRPLEFESTGAAVLGLWNGIDPGSASIAYSFGSGNVVGRYAGAALRASTAAMAIGLLVVAAVSWRRFSPDHSDHERARALAAAAASILAVVIALGKVGSLQFLVWLIPLGVLGALAAGDAAGLLLLMAVLIAAQIVFPIASGAAEAMRPGPYVVVLARNVLLLVWAARALVTAKAAAYSR